VVQKEEERRGARNEGRGKNSLVNFCLLHLNSLLHSLLFLFIFFLLLCFSTLHSGGGDVMTYFLRHSETNIFSAACIDMPLPKWLTQ
jgi:hypothetical protein